MSLPLPLSTLVQNQLPDFVRSQYPTFVAFLEAYYAYLEQTNKGTDFARNLLSYRDLDQTLTEFEEYFQKQFLANIPRTALTNQKTLLKHAKEFYRTRGTAQSFEFFFRAVYGDTATLVYPKDFILRTSDGHYVRNKALRLFQEFSISTTAAGVATDYTLFEMITDATKLTAYLNGTLVTNYTISPNEKKITFAAAPTGTLKLVYTSQSLIERISEKTAILSLTGDTSGATAVTEDANEIVLGATRTWELTMTMTNTRTFAQGETITAVVSGTGEILHFTTESLVESIAVTDGGASYNVGDTVIVTGGSPLIPATAVIDQVYLALIESLIMTNGGAGFQEVRPIVIDSVPNTGFTGVVSTVDTSGNTHANTITLNQDLIIHYANVLISNANYGMASSISENVNTTIADALVSGTVTGLGPITAMTLLTSTTQFLTLPTFHVAPPQLAITANVHSIAATANVGIDSLGILGNTTIMFGGTGYVLYDDLIFTANTGPYPDAYGWGGAAQVTELHTANAGIKAITFTPMRLNGRVAKTNATTTLTGTGTRFTTDLKVADRIYVTGQSRYINVITSDTSLTVNVNWTSTTTNTSAGIYGRTFVGGERYRQSVLPNVSISSSNSAAANASILVTAIFGDGELITASAPHLPGEIRSIALVNRGSGYTDTPTIDLSTTGNGLATALASLLASAFTYPGRFVTTDGLLSSDQRMQDGDYYQNFSYVIKSKTALTTYKDILKTLLHPAGLKLFAEYVHETHIDSMAEGRQIVGQMETVNTEITLSGTVAVTAGSNLVTGTATTFNVANAAGTIALGRSIRVNTELQTISSIINNTSLRITGTYTDSASAQTIIVIRTV